MRIALTVAAAVLLSSAVSGQAGSSYPSPPGVDSSHQGAMPSGAPGMAHMQKTPEERAAHRQRKAAKLAAMTPEQRHEWKQRRAARRAARQQSPQV